MRKRLVAGNWKMNKTQAEATALVEAFIRDVDLRDEVEVVLCPPYLALGCVQDLIKGTHVQLGAQDVFWMQSGAYTGQVSAQMLDDVGADYCIVGHSETRGKFGKLEVPDSTLGFFSETDETVNLKIQALLYCNIAPILCVGETLSERESGKTDSVIQSQLTGALSRLVPDELYSLVVAYEPVWAIGTGQTCDSAEAQRVCGMIRSALPGELRDRVRVLYGGSVKASNAKELFTQPDIDGGLVGGASLDAHEFAQIVANA